jgi:hypothetical protein
LLAFALTLSVNSAFLPFLFFSTLALSGRRRLSGLFDGSFLKLGKLPSNGSTVNHHGPEVHPRSASLPLQPRDTHEVRQRRKSAGGNATVFVVRRIYDLFYLNLRRRKGS